MSINVYWSCLEDQWLRANPPVPVYKDFLNKSQYPETGIQKCPAFTAELKNVYGIKSLYEYNFSIEDNNLKSNMYDQPFFDRHVLIRSLKERTFSFLQYYTFFTESDSLLMSANIQPYLENNNPINDRCICFPGVFDIGKWYRNLDFAFYLKEQYDQFIINEDQIFCYIKFHTGEKINFIQHRHSPKLVSLLSEVIASKTFTSSSRNLITYYKMFKTKKMIINEIKKNIL